MKITSAGFKVLVGTVIFAGFLTVSSEFSRSQSEKPGVRTGWNPEKQILLAAALPVPPRPLSLGVPEFAAKEIPVPVIHSVTKPQAEKVSTLETSPPIPKVMKPAKAREEKAGRKIAKPLPGEVASPKLSPLALLDHTELQAMVNDLDYEILPGRGVRFRYSGLPQDPVGHLWFLKRPLDLRGKTIRIDYLGYVPREMTFRIAKSGTSAAVIKKVKLEDAPYETRSLFIEIPNTIPFKEVKYLEFWIDRKGAGRSYGDFMIEKVRVIETSEKARQAVDESQPEPFPFDRPFIPTHLMRTEVPAT